MTESELRDELPRRRLWLMTRAAPLNPDQIDELRQQFGASW